MLDKGKIELISVFNCVWVVFAAKVYPKDVRIFTVAVFNVDWLKLDFRGLVVVGCLISKMKLI